MSTISVSLTSTHLISQDYGTVTSGQEYYIFNVHSTFFEVFIIDFTAECKQRNLLNSKKLHTLFFYSTDVLSQSTG